MPPLLLVVVAAAAAARPVDMLVHPNPGLFVVDRLHTALARLRREGALVEFGLR